MSLAPICLFCYNRLTTLQQTINALKNNHLASESALYIFSDGPKNEQGAAAVNAVREYLRTVQGFKSIEIRSAKYNQGLASSIISGVTEIVNRFGKIIVVEDDLVTSPFFLQYMNDALDVYENNENVACISGYAYPLSVELPETFFIRGAECWGWATWRRGWNIFDSDGQKLLAELEENKLCQEFDFNNTFPYTEMLKLQIAGGNSSWAIRWYASTFLANKLCLYPYESLVQNIGMDGSGTHCDTTNKYATKLTQHRIPIIPIIPSHEENIQARQAMARHFWDLCKRWEIPGIISKHRVGERRIIILFNLFKFEFCKQSRNRHRH